jgi:class 3 adenylate cyclase
VRASLAISDGARRLGLEVRVGIHVGEVELRGQDLLGLAVHIANRVCGVARPGEVLVTGTVSDSLAGAGLQFVDHGGHKLKGLPGRWHLYAVRGLPQYELGLADFDHDTT